MEKFRIVAKMSQIQGTSRGHTVHLKMGAIAAFPLSQTLITNATIRGF